MLVLDVREGASEAFGALKTIVFFTDRYQSDNRGNYCNQSESVAVPVGSLPSNFKIFKFEFKKRKNARKIYKKILQDLQNVQIGLPSQFLFFMLSFVGIALFAINQVNILIL
jgi:hypothetical protein